MPEIVGTWRLVLTRGTNDRGVRQHRELVFERIA